MLAKLLAGRDRDASPFDDEVPKVDARAPTGSSRSSSSTSTATRPRKNQRLRQPSYRGVRADLSPEDLLT